MTLYLIALVLSAARHYRLGFVIASDVCQNVFFPQNGVLSNIAAHVITIDLEKNISDATSIARTMTVIAPRPSVCEGSVAFRTWRDNVPCMKIFCIQPDVTPV